jgi:hypothetical protein
VILCLDRGRNPDAVFLSLLKEFHRKLLARDALLIVCGVQSEMRVALAANGLEVTIRDDVSLQDQFVDEASSTNHLRTV